MNLINLKMLKYFEKNLNRKIVTKVYNVHDHDVLVDLVHIPEGGKMQISSKLEVYRANQDQIRNQRTWLRRNTLF